MLAPAVRQAWLDQDPVFFADHERRAAMQLRDGRRGRGRLGWYGAWHTLHPRQPVLMPEDEFWNTFHFAPFVAEYWIDERVPAIPAWRVSAEDLVRDPRLEDGDTILHAAAVMYVTGSIPPGGVPPVELWRIRRMRLVRDGERFVAPADPSLSLELRTTASGERTLQTGRNLGRWSVLAWVAGQDAPRWLSDVTLEAGRAVSLGPGSAGGELTQLVLADVGREVVR